MDAVLAALYAAFKPGMVSESERVIMDREGKFLDEVEKRLSAVDFGRLWEISTDIGTVRAEESFVLGYRLGPQLMLASLGTEELGV